MTGPGQPASQVLQKARQRLLRLGLTDDHILSLPKVATATFGPSHLDPLQADPHFGAIVQRIVRFLRGGRGLSIAVTDDGRRGNARVHTAIQMAAGLTRHGIHVVVVDMDLQHPGLNGLVPDTQSEGLIDMVRFGRSCRSVLQKPLSSGPSLLAAGSFPVQEPLPFDEDSIRSVLHRVSLHCELALYVAPLLPDGNVLNPVVRLCEHVVLVQSVSETSVDVVERIQLMQQARLHVAGVVLFEASGEQVAEPQKWRPGSLYDGPAPGTAATGVAAAPSGPSTSSAASGAAAATPPVFSEPVAPPPGSSGPAPPPVVEPPTPARPEPPIPHIPWTGRQAEPPPAEPSNDEGIPEIHLPDETDRVGPFTSQPQPVARTTPSQQPEAGPPTPGASEEQPTGAEAIERLWSQAEPSSKPPALNEEEQYSEFEGAYNQSADSFARGESEQVDLRTSGFSPPEYDDTETEFAYDDGNNWSRTPLYILVTMLVLVGGFFGWALWTKRGIEQQVGQQLLDTEWIDAPQPADASGVPDDAAAVPKGDATLPMGGLKGVGEASGKKVTDPPSRPSKVEDAVPHKQPAATRPPVQPPVTRQAAPAAEKDATEEMAPIKVPSPEDPVVGGGAGKTVTPPERSTAGAVGDSQYTVHVGSFRQLEQAYQEIAALQKRGHTGRAVRTDLGEKGIWYRIYVGSFATRPEAEKVRDGILELPEYNYAQVKRLP